MRRVYASIFVVSTLVNVACADSNTTEPIDGTTWGDDASSLSVRPEGLTLQLLAPGSCVGSFVETIQPITSSSFQLLGTFIQLIGASPGRLMYTATLSGAIRDNVMTLTVVIPSLSRTIGPLQLTRGVAHTWRTCAYP